jgi:Peptidase family M28
LQRESLPGVRRILFAIVPTAIAFALSLVTLDPPRPRPATAPPNQFSAERARNLLYQMVGNDVPHPIGSPDNDHVRQFIVDQFTRLGYDPQVQTAFACDEYGTCGLVKNVLARLDGSEPGAAVLLAAHYDSVPAGPGASDDGAGAAAVLEIARALKSMPVPRHSIILMIDDGEEAGLLGARAFVNYHPWAHEVRAAVNLEARGTAGPSIMFETGSANEWAVRLFALHASHPTTNSISYTVYKMLPNDTDFTVFKAAGIEGLNFAFIGDVAHYHTPLDNFANANPASLQHHGDNALPSIVALANTDLENLPRSEAAYFDVFGHWVARWPARRSWPAGIIALLLVIVQVFWLVHTRRLTPAQLRWGLIAWIVVVAATAVLAVILLRLLGIMGATPVNWIAHPLPILVAMWSLALSAVIMHAVMFGRRARFWGLWAGTWIWMAVLSLVCAWRLPGFVPVFLVSLCVAAVSGLPFAFHRTVDASGSVIPVTLAAVASGIAGFAVALLMHDALGLRQLWVLPVVGTILLAPLLPVSADLRESGGLSGVAVLVGPFLVTLAAFFAASVVPAFSARSPERVNLEYWLDADSGRAQWIVRPDSGRLPEQIGLATKFHEIRRGPLPWNTAPGFVADAPNLGLSAPTFTILESSVQNGRHAYRTLLRSERAAREATVLFPSNSGIGSVEMEGFPVPAESELVSRYSDGWNVYRCVTMPVKGASLSFTLPIGRSVAVYVIDQTFRLPAEGNFLLKARPLTATSSQDGDVTLVVRRVELIP